LFRPIAFGYGSNESTDLKRGFTKIKMGVVKPPDVLYPKPISKKTRATHTQKKRELPIPKKKNPAFIFLGFSLFLFLPP
jgi:hypothetical protein